MIKLLKKLLKLELHWQILIALIIGVILGLLLTPSYTLTKPALEKLRSQVISGDPDSKIKRFEGKVYVEVEGDPAGNRLNMQEIEDKMYVEISFMPEAVVNELEKLKDETYHTKKAFMKAVASAVGEAYAGKFGKAIVKAAEFRPVNYVSWLGDLFLRALRMVIVPLILSSIISGITGIGTAENLGRLGFKTMAYYLTTSFFAIIVGLFFVNILRPGVGANLGLIEEVEGLSTARESFGETLINIIPTNIFDALSNGAMLSIIFFAIVFGFFIMRVEPRFGDPLKNLFNAAFEVMMKITMFVIKFTPLGIIGIVAKVVSEQADSLGDVLSSLGIYMIAVLAALTFHAAITLPAMLKLIGKINPRKYFKNMSSTLLTAFSTSSSSATLPLTMKSVEYGNGVSNKVTSFTLPLGATVNMDGTALYECVAAMFIAQAYGYELGFFEQMIVVMTALLASIGAAGIPMAGLVMITVVLSAVGLPLEGVGLILAVDRILDMCRTTVNVWSDSCGAGIIASSEGEELPDIR